MMELQPQTASLVAGLYQSNAVRAKLVGGTVEGCRIMSASRDTEFRGKVSHDFDDENRIGGRALGEVNLTCAVEFPIL
jgi:hypothetical protein